MKLKRTLGDLLFNIGLGFKFLHGLIEIFIAFLILSLNRNMVAKGITFFFHKELVEDPTDFLAKIIINFASGSLLDYKILFFFLLIGYGLINILLVYGLVKKKLWVYPTAMVTYSIFLVYQGYKYFITHSIWFAILCIFDLVFINLIAYEYRRVRYG